MIVLFSLCSSISLIITCVRLIQDLSTYTQRTSWKWRRRSMWKSTGELSGLNNTHTHKDVGKRQWPPRMFENRFSLASHFFWGLWSIIQARLSTIEFGYLVSFGNTFLTSVFCLYPQWRDKRLTLNQNWRSGDRLVQRMSDIFGCSFFADLVLILLLSWFL